VLGCPGASDGPVAMRASPADMNQQYKHTKAYDNHNINTFTYMTYICLNKLLNHTINKYVNEKLTRKECVNKQTFKHLNIYNIISAFTLKDDRVERYILEQQRSKRLLFLRNIYHPDILYKLSLPTYTW